MALLALPFPLSIGRVSVRLSQSLLSLPPPSLRVSVKRIRCSAVPDELDIERAQLATSATPSLAVTYTALRPAADLVVEFYGLINRRDPEAALNLISDDCVYEDLAFAKQFVGKEATFDLFKKFTDGMGSDLAFVIDDITTGDPDAAGLTWHLAWKDKPFPFSKGCSFCRCQVINGQRKIIYMRDIVESPMKPGDTSLVAIKGVTSLLERFPQISEKW